MNFSWQGKNVLVTGAGGFIGSRLTERLAHNGALVKAFVRYNSRGDTGLLNLLDSETLNSIEVIMGDLRDPDGVRKAIKGVDIVFHLGAIIAIPYSYIHPREFVETNIGGTLNVITASMDEGVKRIIHTSTSEVYGTAKYTPIDEDHPLQGQSPYSASKIGADKIVESFHRSFNLPVVTIRPFNTYGPRQSARAIIPTIICQALTSEKIQLGSLKPSRDLTFVDDTVDGFIKAGEKENILGETINIGSGVEIDIGTLSKKIPEIMDKETSVIHEERRVRPQESEVLRLVADTGKAYKLLGWQAKISLEDGLRRTIEWFSENINRYGPEDYQV